MRSIMISFCVTLLLSALLIIHSNLHHGVGFVQEIARSKREALEIIIGAGGGSDAPAPFPEPEYPPPTPHPEPESPPPTPPPAPAPPSTSPALAPSTTPPPTTTPAPAPSTTTPAPAPSTTPAPAPSTTPVPAPSTTPAPAPSTTTPAPAPSTTTPAPVPSTQDLRENARETLLNFEDIIEDNNFTKYWKKGEDVCTYKGVRCDRLPNGDGGNATSGLDFNGAGFESKDKNKPLTLSGILDKIPELTFFHVNSNNFSGIVPTKITRFKYFYELDLSNNKLIGEFPRAVIDAKQLVFVDLRFNNYYGTVPPELFKKDLDVIFINNNKFSGKLPENFGSTPARYLTFANNYFTGPIPSSIGQASKTLTEILLLGNQFSGCLPPEIGKLKKMTVFDVSKNQLRGPIPNSFVCLKRILLLNLADNQFSGTVPEMLCKLPGLRNNGILDLRNNYFTEVGAECKKLIASGVLKVTNNCISGEMNQRPPEICDRFFKSKKPCPNPKPLLTYIPCKVAYSSTKQTVDLPPTAAAPAPFTYKSLKPHRL